jgi:uncharacterized Zn-finger protein
VSTPNSASSCSTEETVLLMSKSGEPSRRIYIHMSKNSGSNLGKKKTNSSIRGFDALAQNLDI